MAEENPFSSTQAFDEVLLDVATVIELGPQDRRVAESRYRRLADHLQRPASPLAGLLNNGSSLIYAQGSIATSTTVLSGVEDEDRFDVDAVVEIDVPPEWRDSDPLDFLAEALKGFPGVEEIERCTRCVQLRFRNMHMDVTVLDRREKIPGERPGKIFHSPDEGASTRVPSNPWGFTDWFRSRMATDQDEFRRILAERRGVSSPQRLKFIDEQERQVLAEADQQELPPVIPAGMDAIEAVALKLLKRYLNLRYDGSSRGKPPSIYLTKLVGDFGAAGGGLAVQLYYLAKSMGRNMREHLDGGTWPLEVNPSYEKDEINDRWPEHSADGKADMEAFAEAVEALCGRLEGAVSSSMSEIMDIVHELFGERVAGQTREILKARYDRRDRPTPVHIAPRSGHVLANQDADTIAGAVASKAHNFHAGVINNVREDG